jgi:anti-anti-sigma regulatory factor
MSATFRITSTPRHQGRPVHPSLLPPARPVLVEVDVGDQVAAQRQLPGGALLSDRRPNVDVAELQLVGEVDAFDRGAIVDACTAVGLEGARHLRIDGSELAFVDLRILETFAKVALHFHRLGGSFELTGLGKPFASMWAGIAPDTAVPLPPSQGHLDDRVVPLQRRKPAAATGKPTPGLMQAREPVPALRIVPDIGDDEATRPA